eukprot:2912445-Alexandrium_andersonii.AAC.1
MSASLVGSEMCIRDSPQARQLRRMPFQRAVVQASHFSSGWGRMQVSRPCLLYTSDAADDM